ncbi:hypothetical protein P6709_15350 [Jeotgalibacillus sp. ET6]|uniref:hypothetical protein n=1 Tax=Jeotgalibacillus sp. ET6 TaxID=3037260 RepID=UPI00241853EF|nr:hypothetical protein [Jeotgalibacillus sp. ET6]MDG5473128.1 hypothetical protein [Jeotgalibacillus sp. ET6]
MSVGHNQEEIVKPSEMNAEELPENETFEDEFTRGFMKSTEKVEGGLYEFTSGTDLYEMSIPEGTVIDQKLYEVDSDKKSEYFLSTISNENKSVTQFRVTFVDFNKQESIEKNLNRLQSGKENELVFEEVESDETLVYIAPLPYTEDEGYGETFGYTVFVQNTNGTGSVDLIYDTFCSEENKNDCSYESMKEGEREKILEIASSVTFKKSDENT